jgi:hypothetical protein
MLARYARIDEYLLVTWLVLEARSGLPDGNAAGASRGFLSRTSSLLRSYELCAHRKEEITRGSPSTPFCCCPLGKENNP